MRTTLAAACLTLSTLSALPADPPTTGKGLGIASLPNLRDVGGHKTRDGRVVRTGLLYRSGQPVKVAPDDAKKLAALGLKSVYDLRTADERKSAPDELPPGVEATWLDVLADSDGKAPTELRAILRDPKGARRPRWPGWTLCSGRPIASSCRSRACAEGLRQAVSGTRRGRGVAGRRPLHVG